MKWKIGIPLLLVYIALAFSGCSANLFSYLNPTDPGLVNDANILVAMGDNYVNKLDYTNAYRAYSRALSLAPRNSRAMEGAALSYTYMHFTFSKLFNCIMAGDFTSLGANPFYDVSTVATHNLLNIVNGNCDGVIPSTDVNDNLNFFIFCGYYAVFYLIDSDNDGDIDWDTNDYIYMDSNYVMANRVMDVVISCTNSTNMIPFIGMAYNFYHEKRIGYTNLRYWSDRSMGIIGSALYNENTLEMVKQISNIFVNYDTNFQTFFKFFETNKIIDFVGVASYYDMSIFFPAVWDDFTNQIRAQGIFPPSDFTNAMPDMTNVYPVLLSNYGRASLDF